LFESEQDVLHKLAQILWPLSVSPDDDKHLALETTLYRQSCQGLLLPLKRQRQEPDNQIKAVELHLKPQAADEMALVEESGSGYPTKSIGNDCDD
jgi:hypothetical protein